MSAPDEIQVSISQASVKQIIEAKVQAAIVAALTPNADAFIDAIVTKALNVKASGERYRYARDNDIPTVLNEMVMDMVRAETQQALKRWMEKNREKFADKFDKALRDNKELTKKIADSMITALLAANAYNFIVKIEPKEIR